MRYHDHGQINRHPDTIVCNCAECGELIVVGIGTGTETGLRKVHRIKGRPYCSECIQVLDPPPGPSCPAEHHDINYHGGQFHRGEW